MLWRANLYLEEEVNDWNEEHPWASADNEWNYFFPRRPSAPGEVVEERLNPDEFEVKEQDYLVPGVLQRGDGMQVVSLPEFTYPHGVDNGTTRGVVAYSYGCQDNPFEFRDKLLQQKNLLAEVFDINGNVEGQPGFMADVPWQDTSAPGGENGWYNYIFPKKMDFNPRLDDFVNYGSVPDQVSDYTAGDFAYVPGLAFTAFQEKNHKPPYDWENAISAGVDCVGFVQRSASYAGNSYAWGDIRGHDILVRDLTGENLEDWYSDVRQHPKSSTESSTKITNSEDRDGFIYRNLDLVKPGDVLVIFDTDGDLPGATVDDKDVAASIHTAIIGSIDLPTENQALGLEHFVVIESTWDAALQIEWAEVTKSQRLSAYEFRQWEIVRLNHE